VIRVILSFKADRPLHADDRAICRKFIRDQDIRTDRDSPVAGKRRSPRRIPYGK
jgi:hypothetical protein